MSYHQSNMPYYPPGSAGLGAFALVANDTMPAGSQVTVRFAADNDPAPDRAARASALRNNYNLDLQNWTRNAAGTRHEVRVRLGDMPRKVVAVRDAIAAVFRSYGGTGAGSWSYQSPWDAEPIAGPTQSSRAAARTRATDAPGPVPGTSSGGPVPVQDTRCTTMGGRCYDYAHPPSGLPAGRWVSNKCANVPGLSTRCYVPNAAGGSTGSGRGSGGGGGGGTPPPSDITRSFSSPTGGDVDPATAFMVSGLVILGGVIVYFGWKRWKSRKGTKEFTATVKRTPAKALPRAANRRGRRGRNRRRNGGEERRRFYLEKVRLDRQGYDRGGQYWGVGMPLYLFDDGGQVNDHVRAYDRAHAKELIRRRFAAYPFTIVFTR